MTRLLLSLFVFTLVLIFGGVLAQLMITDAGVVLISWRAWVVETTLWGATAVLLTIVCLWLFIAVVWRKFGPTQLLNRYRHRRDSNAAKKETAIAIESWLKGNDERAIKALARVAAAGGSDRLPAAVSLAIGMEQTDWQQRYAEFITDDHELKLFADVLQAERFWQKQKIEDFTDLMLSQFELRQIPWLRARFWQAMLDQQRASELITMVNEAANIQPDLRQDWLSKAAVQALDQCHTNPVKGNQILKALSKAQRNIVEVAIAEVNYLVSIAEHDTAFKRAKLVLNSPANSELAKLLLDIKVDTLPKITFLESIQPANAGPIFCSALGVLNLEQQLWGNAQSLLESAWQQGDKAAGLHLAELFEQRKMQDQANRIYRQIATEVS